MSLIELAANITLPSKKGPVEIERMSVYSPSSIPDLIIETVNPIPNVGYCNGMDKNHLCNDKIFLDGVIAHLRTMGYVGASFGRGELGAQSSFMVNMEPHTDFNDFLRPFGWVHYDEVYDDNGNPSIL